MANDEDKTVMMDAAGSPEEASAPEETASPEVAAPPPVPAAPTPSASPAGPPPMRYPDDPMQQTASTPELQPYESYMPDRPPVNMLVGSGIGIAISIIICSVALIEYLSSAAEAQYAASAGENPELVEARTSGQQLLNSAGVDPDRENAPRVPIRDAMNYLIANPQRLTVKTNWPTCKVQDVPTAPAPGATPTPPGGPASP